MNGATARNLLALASTVAFLAVCSGGQAPFRMVQFCLTGVQQIPAFTRFMSEIAQQYRMEFTDRSGQTRVELQALASDNKDVPLPTPAVNIGATHGDEFSFGAANIGLPSEQVVVGFNGTKLAEAKQFANAVVGKLSTHWHVHEVPQGRGAFALANCS
jgi:hypothetical protein